MFACIPKFHPAVMLASLEVVSIRRRTLYSLAVRHTKPTVNPILATQVRDWNRSAELAGDLVRALPERSLRASGHETFYFVLDHICEYFSATNLTNRVTRAGTCYSTCNTTWNWKLWLTVAKGLGFWFVLACLTSALVGCNNKTNSTTWFHFAPRLLGWILTLACEYSVRTSVREPAMEPLVAPAVDGSWKAITNRGSGLLTSCCFGPLAHQMVESILCQLTWFLAALTFMEAFVSMGVVLLQNPAWMHCPAFRLGALAIHTIAMMLAQQFVPRSGTMGSKLLQEDAINSPSTQEALATHSAHPKASPPVGFWLPILQTARSLLKTSLLSKLALHPSSSTKSQSSTFSSEPCNSPSSLQHLTLHSSSLSPQVLAGMYPCHSSNDTSQLIQRHFNYWELQHLEAAGSPGDVSDGPSLLGKTRMLLGGQHVSLDTQAPLPVATCQVECTTVSHEQQGNGAWIPWQLEASTSSSNSQVPSGPDHGEVAASRSSNELNPLNRVALTPAGPMHRLDLSPKMAAATAATLSRVTSCNVPGSLETAQPDQAAALDLSKILNKHARGKASARRRTALYKGLTRARMISVKVHSHPEPLIEFAEAMKVGMAHAMQSILPDTSARNIEMVTFPGCVQMLTWIQHTMGDTPLEGLMRMMLDPPISECSARVAKSIQPVLDHVYNSLPEANDVQCADITMGGVGFTYTKDEAGRVQSTLLTPPRLEQNAGQLVMQGASARFTPSLALPCPQDEVTTHKVDNEPIAGRAGRCAALPWPVALEMGQVSEIVVQLMNLEALGGQNSVRIIAQHANTILLDRTVEVQPVDCAVRFRLRAPECGVVRVALLLPSSSCVLAQLPFLVTTPEGVAEATHLFLTQLDEAAESSGVDITTTAERCLCLYQQHMVWAEHFAPFVDDIAFIMSFSREVLSVLSPRLLHETVSSYEDQVAFVLEFLCGQGLWHLAQVVVRAVMDTELPADMWTGSKLSLAVGESLQLLSQAEFGSLPDVASSQEAVHLMDSMGTNTTCSIDDGPWLSPSGDDSVGGSIDDASVFRVPARPAWWDSVATPGKLDRSASNDAVLPCLAGVKCWDSPGRLSDGGWSISSTPVHQENETSCDTSCISLLASHTATDCCLMPSSLPISPGSSRQDLEAWDGGEYCGKEAMQGGDAGSLGSFSYDGHDASVAGGDVRPLGCHSCDYEGSFSDLNMERQGPYSCFHEGLVPAGKGGELGPCSYCDERSLPGGSMGGMGGYSWRGERSVHGGSVGAASTLRTLDRASSQDLEWPATPGMEVGDLLTLLSSRSLAHHAEECPSNTLECPSNNPAGPQGNRTGYSNPAGNAHQQPGHVQQDPVHTQQEPVHAQQLCTTPTRANTGLLAFDTPSTPPEGIAASASVHKAPAAPQRQNTMLVNYAELHLADLLATAQWFPQHKMHEETFVPQPELAGSGDMQQQQSNTLPPKHLNKTRTRRASYAAPTVHSPWGLLGGVACSNAAGNHPLAGVNHTPAVLRRRHSMLVDPAMLRRQSLLVEGTRYSTQHGMAQAGYSNCRHSACLPVTPFAMSGMCEADWESWEQLDARLAKHFHQTCAVAPTLQARSHAKIEDAGHVAESGDAGYPSFVLHPPEPEACMHSMVAPPVGPSGFTQANSSIIINGPCGKVNTCTRASHLTGGFDSTRTSKGIAGSHDSIRPDGSYWADSSSSPAMVSRATDPSGGCVYFSADNATCTCDPKIVDYNENPTRADVPTRSNLGDQHPRFCNLFVCDKLSGTLHSCSQPSSGMKWTTTPAATSYLSGFGNAGASCSKMDDQIGIGWDCMPWEQSQARSRPHDSLQEPFCMQEAPGGDQAEPLASLEDHCLQVLVRSQDLVRTQDNQLGSARPARGQTERSARPLDRHFECSERPTEFLLERSETSMDGPLEGLARPGSSLRAACNAFINQPQSVASNSSATRPGSPLSACPAQHIPLWAVSTSAQPARAAGHHVQPCNAPRLCRASYAAVNATHQGHDDMDGDLMGHPYDMQGGHSSLFLESEVQPAPSGEQYNIGQQYAPSGQQCDAEGLCTMSSLNEDLAAAAYQHKVHYTDCMAWAINSTYTTDAQIDAMPIKGHIDQHTIMPNLEPTRTSFFPLADMTGQAALDSSGTVGNALRKRTAQCAAGTAATTIADAAPPADTSAPPGAVVANPVVATATQSSQLSCVSCLHSYGSNRAAQMAELCETMQHSPDCEATASSTAYDRVQDSFVLPPTYSQQVPLQASINHMSKADCIGSPVSTYPAASNPVCNNPVASNPVCPYQVDANPATTYPAVSNPVCSYPVAARSEPSCPLAAFSTVPTCPLATCPTSTPQARQQQHCSHEVRPWRLHSVAYAPDFAACPLGSEEHAPGVQQSCHGMRQPPQALTPAPVGQYAPPLPCTSVAAHDCSWKHLLAPARTSCVVQEPSHANLAEAGCNPAPGSEDVAGEDPVALPQGSFALPKGSFALLKGSFELPQGSFELPQDSFELPQDSFDLPEDSFVLPYENTLHIPSLSPRSATNPMQVLESATLHIPAPGSKCQLVPMHATGNRIPAFLSPCYPLSPSPLLKKKLCELQYESAKVPNNILCEPPYKTAMAHSDSRLNAHVLGAAASTLSSVEPASRHSSSWDMATSSCSTGIVLEGHSRGHAQRNPGVLQTDGVTFKTVSLGITPAQGVALQMGSEADCATASAACLAECTGTRSVMPECSLAHLEQLYGPRLNGSDVGANAVCQGTAQQADASITARTLAGQQHAVMCSPGGGQMACDGFGAWTATNSQTSRPSQQANPHQAPQAAQPLLNAAAKHPGCALSAESCDSTTSPCDSTGFLVAAPSRVHAAYAKLKVSGSTTWSPKITSCTAATMSSAAAAPSTAAAASRAAWGIHLWDALALILLLLHCAAAVAGSNDSKEAMWLSACALIMTGVALLGKWSGRMGYVSGAKLASHFIVGVSAAVYCHDVSVLAAVVLLQRGWLLDQLGGVYFKQVSWQLHTACAVGQLLLSLLVMFYGRHNPSEAVLVQMALSAVLSAGLSCVMKSCTLLEGGSITESHGRQGGLTVEDVVQGT